MGDLALISILATCAAGALLAPSLCKAAGSKAAWLLALVPALSLLVLASHTQTVLSGRAVVETWPWAKSLGLELALRLDGLGLLFAGLISFIGVLVVLYSGAYLKGHPQLGRFFASLMVFMGAMLGIALSDNILAIFVFWELTSISSYMLIGFDHKRDKARRAATQALLTTAMGGLALLVGLILLGLATGSWRVSDISAAQIVGHAWYPWIVALVALGCATKSAQFPFHFWLPNAMEAPAPVSAYLHSSTMVKAGVFLLARLTPALGAADASGQTPALWSTTLTVMGAVTAVYAGLRALRERNLKPMLAYSTVSSLGMIVLGLGIGSDLAIQGALAFLFAHALYKGSLFMVAGALEHETGEKDTEKLRGLFGMSPVLAIAAMIAAVSMIGLIATPGFVSKEVLLEGATHAARAMGLSGSAAAILATLALALAAAFGGVVAIATGIRPFLGKRLPTPDEPHAVPFGLFIGPLLLALVAITFVAKLDWASSLINAASFAVLRHDPHTHLHFFHGVTPELAVSLGAVTLALILYFARHHVRRFFDALAGLDRVGPEAAYEGTLTGSMRLATFVTQHTQSGRVRVYLLWILTTSAACVIAAFLHFGVRAGPKLSPIRPIDLVLAGIVLVAGIATAFAQRRLATIASLGVMGLGVSLIYVVYGAPDLALTQICVEALSTVMLLLVFRRVPDFRRISVGSAKWRDALISILLGAMVAAMVYFAATTQHDGFLRSEMANRSYPEAHGRNVVNVILVDFRGLDTMGEITVLAAAALGVYSLLRPSLRDAAAHARERIRIYKGGAR